MSGVLILALAYAFVVMLAVVGYAMFGGDDPRIPPGTGRDQ